MATGVLVGASLLGAGASYKANKENQEYQEKQDNIQSRLNKLNARRDKVSAYRERIRTEASQVQSATNTGANGVGLNSSGFAGGISSLETQYGANNQYVNQVNGLREFSGNIENKAGQYQSLSSLFGGVAGVAGNNFGGSSGLNSTMRTLFKG